MGSAVGWQHSAVVAGALLLLAAGCSPGGKAPPVAGDHPLTQVSARVYVLTGANARPNPGNQGFMNNPGFVVGAKGVVVVDPGASVQVGELLLSQIATVTSAPVIAVFNTHVHGDHWLANQAIKARYPRAVIYAHPNMKAKAAVEGARWLALLDGLTHGAVRGTEVVVPDTTIEDGETLRLGDLRFRIYHTGKAHTDGDIMIEVVGEGVLFVGDNAILGCVARMDEGSFRGNVAALEVALASPARHFIPGHGPVSGREGVRSYQRYLGTLYAEVKKGYDQGLADFEMQPRVVEALAPYREWVDFGVQVARHVSLAYLEIEAESF